MKKNKAIQFLQYSILIIFSALPQLYFGHKIKNNSFPSWMYLYINNLTLIRVFYPISKFYNNDVKWIALNI